MSTAIALPNAVKSASPAVREYVTSIVGRLGRAREALSHERGVGGAMGDGAWTVGGAVASGVIAGAIGDDNGEWDGLPVAVLVGVAAVGVGAGGSMPWLVHAGFGAISGYAQQYGFAMGHKMLKKSA